MGLKEIFSNLAILGLLVFSIMAFMITTQTDSNLELKITNNSIINQTYGELETSLSSNDAQTASDNFGNIPPTQQYGELEVNSIVSPTSTAKTITIAIWNVFIKLPQAILGVSPIVASLISSILLILIIIGIWAIYKGVVS